MSTKRSPHDAEAMMLVKYRNVFGSDQGKAVLLDIIAEAGVFDIQGQLTPEAAAVRKLGLKILAKTSLTMDIQPAMIDAVMNQTKDVTIEQVISHIEKHRGVKP